MSSEKHAAAVYRDFEKLYRLVSLYKGNLRQIEKQLHYIENNLDVHLRQAFGPTASVKFDFLMSAVYYQNEEVFRSSTPEFTLSYALFCEGVKSIIFRGGLSAQELSEWLLQIRTALDSVGKGEDVDLASVFWRKSTPNIRVALYNNLNSEFTGDEAFDDLPTFDLPEDADDLDELIEKEVLQAEFGAKLESNDAKLAEIEENAWDLPSGDLVIKKMAELGLQDPEIAQKLRRELGDAQVSDRAKRILRFSKIELEHLRKELEHFDENQVEFNLLVRYLDVLERGGYRDSQLYSFVAEGLAGIIQSVLARFHGGLILFLLKKMSHWETEPQLQKIHQILGEKISQSLRQEKNLLQLALAFEEPGKAKIAEELVNFVGPKEFQFMMSALAEVKKPQAVERFLQVLVKNYQDLELVPQIWGPEVIGLAVPVLSNLRWEGKDRFLARCLRSKDIKVAQAAGEQLAFISIEAETALRMYQSLDLRLRRIWLQSLARNSRSESWVPFVRLSLRKDLWQQESDEDLAALWIRVILKYLGKEGVDAFSPWVRARRFYVWPKFPKVRATILEVALRSDEPSIKPFIKALAASERSLMFQGRDLKNLLAERSR